MPKVVSLVLTILLWLPWLPSLQAAENDWIQVMDKDDIKVSKRLIPGTKRYEFRGVGVIDATTATIAAIIEDVPGSPEWQENCLYAEVVKQVQDDKQIQYWICPAPWPVKDRDVEFEVKTEVDFDRIEKDLNTGSIIVIAIKALNNPIKPVNKKYVRLTKLRVKWILEGITGGKTNLTYTVQPDFGLSVPDSFSNFLGKKLPYDTIVGLRKISNKEKYIVAGENITRELLLKADKPDTSNEP